MTVEGSESYRDVAVVMITRNEERAVARIEFRMMTVLKTETVPLEHMEYGTAQIAVGQHDLKMMNQRMSVMFCEDEDHQP